MTPEKIAKLIALAQARFALLSPEEQAAERRSQRESWVRGEMAIGDDRDEVRYRDRLTADMETKA